MDIVRTLHFEGSKGQAELVSRFDSALPYSCVRLDAAEKLGTVEPLPKPLEMEASDKSHRICAEHSVLLDFYLNDLRMRDPFVVVPNLAEQAIIGALTMQKWRIKLEVENGEVLTDPRVAKAILM